MLHIRTILHPTDFSDYSQGAFEMACALARDYSAELLLVHVVPPAHVFAPDGIAVSFPVEEPYDVHARLARLHADDSDVKTDHRVLDGDPTEQILKVARDANADLIVMGTHGSSGLTRLLMGSVAEHVMRKAPCPVLTIRGTFRIPPAHTSAVAQSSQAS
jgi:nucleotide-binding universal stress UspA family protein